MGNTYRMYTKPDGKAAWEAVDLARQRPTG